MQFQCTVFITKNQHKRRQKQGIDIYAQLLTAPSGIEETHQKDPLESFAPWTYFRGFTVYMKI